MKLLISNPNQSHFQNIHELEMTEFNNLISLNLQLRTQSEIHTTIKEAKYHAVIQYFKCE